MFFGYKVSHYPRHPKSLKISIFAHRVTNKWGFSPLSGLLTFIRVKKTASLCEQFLKIRVTLRPVFRKIVLWLFNVQSSSGASHSGN